MSIFNLNNANLNQPKYLQLVDVVRSAIKKGELIAGDSLPSVKSLSESLGFNRHTVMKSFAELIAQGWIESTQRVGYQVVYELPIEASQAAKGKFNKTHTNFNYRLVRSGISLSEYPASKFKYNFSGGQPDMTLFPFSEFKSHMSDALSRPNISELGYGQSAGTADLREEIKIYLRRSRAITNREIVITNGSQEALFIVAQLLLHTGDKVAVEALGYPPAMSAFRNAGADLVGIKQDEKGLIPDDFEAQVIKGNIRLIYLTPLHQYPTTVTLTISRRMKIYQIAAKYQIPIIEDDYDHEFHYRCQPLPPIASQDPEQLVIYISTFSKVMFPGARVGLMAVSKPLAKAIEEYRQLICHKGNVLMESALARWMKSGGFERHIRRTTRKYLQRRDHGISLLKKSDHFEFEQPDGGMALWLRIKNDKISAEELTMKARNSNIYIQHEGDYHFDNANNKDNFIRIGFAGINEVEFARGIELLTKLL